MHLYPFRLKRRILSAIPLFLLTAAFLFLPGCAPDEKERFAYLDSPAEFTVTFPPLDDTALPVVCRAHLSPEKISFTVEEPARSRGLSVVYQNGCCSLEAEGGVPVSLSEEAAEPLTAFCRVLTCSAGTSGTSGAAGGSGGIGNVRHSGGGIEIPSNGGVLHLTEEGIPRTVESPASDGVLRTSVITFWEQKDSPNSNEA